ncbi:hypothetical protein PAXINDRAFT_20559 [Paxillus involutus ATCC 200175]|uniref:Uncharacterized protein n=1 Tax=Paxillus involutus ATCC 200175 TaxID=664439 RepID=A0A0C9T4D0_PAXIN|nr:hypothetical protein PAXINDRAFT_20559 [Paxillus involutus ATCC 200175]
MHGIYDNELQTITTGGGRTDTDSEQNRPSESQAQQDQLRNVRHEAVEVPARPSPFTVEDEEAFFSILERIINENIVPDGYGLLEGEIDEEDAEMVEIIPFGTRGSKSFAVSLTDPIWTARITLPHRQTTSAFTADRSSMVQCLSQTRSIVVTSLTVVINAPANSSPSLMQQQKDSVVNMQGLSNANSSSEPRVGSSARQQILDAFHKRTVKQEPPSKEVRFGNAGPSLAVAKDETLKGFRGLGLGIQPAGGRAKGKASQSRVASRNQAAAGRSDDGNSSQFKVGTWICLINYLDDNGHLGQVQLPTHTALHEMERRGCAHVERADEFTFDIAWTHQQVDEYLRHTVFPAPFEYLERSSKGKQKESSRRRQWVLINKEKQRYEVAPVAEPTGADLARYHGCQKCAVKDSNVIIALRSRVPKKEFVSWDPDCDEIEASDSEFDSEVTEGSKPVRAAHSTTALKRIRQASSIIELSSDNEDKPVFHSLALRRVAHPVYFVEPSFDDIILRDVPDPTSPFSPPRINPWSGDYFLGDDY